MEDDGSCIRKRQEYKNHVWSYDFFYDRTHDNRSYRMPTVIDEFSRERLATEPRRRFTSIDVIEELTNLFIFNVQLTSFGYVRTIAWGLH
jgi:putative transposase